MRHCVEVRMQEHQFIDRSKLPTSKTWNFVPHPLDQLKSHEIDIAREAIIAARGKCLIFFRAIFAQEPAKAELVSFLDAEHSGTLTSSTPRPARQAKVQYDIVHEDKSHDYMESVVDILAEREVVHRVIDQKHQSALTLYVSQLLFVRRLMFPGRNSKRSKVLVSVHRCTRRPFHSLTCLKASR